MVAKHDEEGARRWVASGRFKSPPSSSSSSSSSLCLQEEQAKPHAYISVHFTIWQL